MNKTKILPKGFRKWNADVVERMHSYALKNYLSEKNRKLIASQYQNIKKNFENEINELSESDIIGLIEDNSFDKIMVFLHSEKPFEVQTVKKYLEDQYNKNKSSEETNKTSIDNQTKVDAIDNLRDIIKKLEIESLNAIKDKEKVSSEILVKDKIIGEYKSKAKNLENIVKQLENKIKKLGIKIEEQDKIIGATEKEYGDLVIEKQLIYNQLLQFEENERRIKEQKYLLIGNPFTFNIENKKSIISWNQSIDTENINELKSSSLKKIVFLPRLTTVERSCITELKDIEYINSFIELKKFLAGVE
ncbi:hypothetical protein ERX35_010105 [Macrococcus equipercicus]|uniref:Uncharacterized protein n=1 Tax=Macrococcus equipercicus TaxID=69967 RepID=A0ABQ6R6G0_9STAP|nr:hypothetical protein [Macrococcus equipercicus]KAA1036876.1 hypothetical protein ERX35_010105 [Macrococcus equipercicus]